MEIITWGARFLAVYGALLITFGIFYMPEVIDEFLAKRNARYGLALSGIIAVLLGAFLATVGG